LYQAFKLSDLLCLIAAFVLAAALVNRPFGGESFARFLAYRVELSNGLLFAGLIVLWHVILIWSGLYRSRRFSPPFRLEILEVARGTALAALTLTLAGSFFDLEIINLSVVAWFWSLGFVMIAASRFAMRLGLRSARRTGHNLRHVLIVGTNVRAIRLSKRLKASPSLGYHVVGFVDSDLGHAPALEALNVSIVTDYGGFSEYIRKNVVDEIFIRLPIKSHYDRVVQIMDLARRQGLVVRYFPDFFPVDKNIVVEKFEDFPMVTVGQSQLGTDSALLKRLIDIVGSATMLTLLAPLLMIIAVAIRIDSRGPSLFAQERLGLNKRRFHLYKFRTMVNDAEELQEKFEHLNEAGGPVFKIRDDPRITRLGRLLRSKSLDELPQLFNVLRGDMSLVGPRPLPVRDYEGFSEEAHFRRFSVRPGITCLWQVEGRSDIQFEEWMDLDMKYIDHWSLWLDVRILFKTIFVVFRGSGAY
jgi:exopolysaccharide biosynthesis polyprenyl glycosylphosphotransferase